MGMAFGPTRSEANSDVIDACVVAIDFAIQEMDASAQFAIKIADFLEADAKDDQAGREASFGALKPINDKTTAAVNGFVESAKMCGAK